MSKATQTQPALKAWSTPQLIRLGTIEDVAGNQAAGPQGNGAKS